MNRQLLTAILLLAAAQAASPASVAQSNNDLSQRLATSSVVAVGRLDQYIAEPESMDRMVQDQARTTGFLTGNPAAIVMLTVQPRGTYAFAILSAIKGHPPERLLVRLPRVSVYGTGPAGSAPQIPLKGSYLLILAGTAQDGFLPVGLNPMPIGGKVELPKTPVENDLQAMTTTVVRIFIDSLADPPMRMTAAYLLRDARSEEALKALRPFADDPDDELRASALDCLASNQDISAIMKIGNWHYNTPGRGGNGNLSSLRKYSTREATPYLNRLLLEGDSGYARSMAASVLRQNRLADTTSLPFLVKALRDPTTEGQLVFQSYRLLHELVPDLGVPLDVREFAGAREDEIKRVEQWWAAQHESKP